MVKNNILEVKRIVLKELNKHAYLNKDLKQPSTLLNGALTSTVTSIPVDSTVGFPPAGTVKIGTTEIAYSAISGNSLTISSTNFSGGNAIVDDTSVTLVTFTEGIFSNFKDKLRNTTVTAAVTASAPNVGSGTADLNVGSTAGFPDSGTILVGTEKMTYSEKTDTAFKIDQNGRQADNTSGFVSAIGDITADITATVYFNYN